MTDPIAVVGVSAWMRMMVTLARANGYPVILWPGLASDGMPAEVLRADLAAQIADKGVEMTDDPARVASARLIILATESWRMRATAAALADHLRGYHSLVHTVRGLESTSLMRASQVLRDETPVRQIAALVGPAHPDLHAAGRPGACVVGSKFPLLIEHVQRILGSPVFRVYGNADLVGVEIAAAAARVVAVGIGMIDGLGLGPSARGTLAARGVAEMGRLGVALGASAATFSGLSGLGYLMAQSSDPVGTDVRVGMALIEGLTPDVVQDRFGPDAVELFAAAAALSAAVDAHHVSAHILPPSTPPSLPASASPRPSTICSPWRR